MLRKESRLIRTEAQTCGGNRRQGEEGALFVKYISINYYCGCLSVRRGTMERCSPGAIKSPMSTADNKLSLRRRGISPFLTITWNFVRQRVALALLVNIFRRRSKDERRVAAVEAQYIERGPYVWLEIFIGHGHVRVVLSFCFFVPLISGNL